MWLLGASRLAAIRAAGLGEFSDAKSEDARMVLAAVSRRRYVPLS